MTRAYSNTGYCVACGGNPAGFTDAYTGGVSFPINRTLLNYTNQCYSADNVTWTTSGGNLDNIKSITLTEIILQPKYNITLTVYDSSNLSFIINFNSTIFNNTFSLSSNTTNGTIYFKNITPSNYTISIFIPFFSPKNISVYVNNNLNYQYNVSLVQGICIDTNKFCSNPFFSNGYYYCNIDYIFDCPACNINDYGQNLSLDMCGIVSCSNDCTLQGNTSCYSQYTVQTCLLSDDGCYHNYISNTCSFGTYCYHGSCLSDADIKNFTQNNANNQTDYYSNQAISSRLNLGSKILIIFITICCVFGICIFIGNKFNLSKEGFIMGCICSVAVFILASIPNFPLIGGFIPIWITIIIILILISISFLSLKLGGSHAD